MYPFEADFYSDSKMPLRSIQVVSCISSFFLLLQSHLHNGCTTLCVIIHLSEDILVVPRLGLLQVKLLLKIMSRFLGTLIFISLE